MFCLSTSNYFSKAYYLKVTPITIDTAPLNHNACSNERTTNLSLIRTFIKTKETLEVTRNFTQQDIQVPSKLINEEIVETLLITTQQSIFPFHPTLLPPHYKNKTPCRPTKLQSTVKPSIVPNCSHMDYQSNRPITKKNDHLANKDTQLDITLQSTITFFSLISTLVIQ